jgi:hypothetical protein
MSVVSLQRRCALWLLLAAFAACLNPQPDDNPMAHPGDAKPPAAVTGSGNGSAPESPLVADDESPTTPTTSPQQPPAAAGSMQADAGAAPPDGGTPEADAGSLGD